MADVAVPSIATGAPTPSDTLLGVQAGVVKRFSVQAAVDSVLTPQLSGAIDAVLTARAYTPASLFDAAYTGGWFDNSDLATLFQDSAMTIPAVINGVVGGQADKSGRNNPRTQATTANKPILRGTPTGGNILTNGDFADGTGWTTGTGWAIGSGVATATTASATLTHTLAAAAFRTYRVEYTITRTAGSVQLSFGGTAGVSRALAGTYVDYILATGTGVLTITGTGFSGTIDNIVIYDATVGSVGAPYYLHYDGIAHHLTSASVDFSASDAAFICSAVDVISTSGIFVIAGMGPSTASLNSFHLAGGSYFRTYSKGSGTGGSTNYPHPAGVSVASAVLRISDDTNIQRINGAQVQADTTDQGTGTYNAQIMNFGGRATGGWLEMLEGGVLVVNKMPTTADILTAERYIGKRSNIIF